jgi:hypothetical protein
MRGSALWWLGTVPGRRRLSGMRLPYRALFAVSAVLVVGCMSKGPIASPSASPSPSGVPTPSPSLVPSASPSPSVVPSPSPSVPPGADVAVVRIEQTGGFIAPWVTLDQYPTVALYADGRLIMQGPQMELYPGPALPNLQQTLLTPEGVAQVLQWAADAGLQGEDRFLGRPMPDAGVTLFTVVRPGEAPHTTSVSDLSAPDAETTAVRKFQDLMLSIRSWLPSDVIGEDQPYAWNRLQILSAPADPAAQPDPQLTTISDWPLADLASLGIPVDGDGGHRCGVIEGADLDTLRPALATANELTLWRSGNALYTVLLHPLLPDDAGCPGFAGP